MKNFLLSLLLLAGVVSSNASEPLTIHFFGSATCGECLELKESILKPLASSNEGKLILKIYDTDSDSGLTILLKMEKEYGVKNDAAQMLFLPDTFLSGYDDIKHLAKGMIESRLNNAAALQKKTVSAEPANLTAVLQGKAMDWGFFAGTVATGLVDGINPCAIATMIFLVSFLATRKKKKGEILIIGLTYTAAVFITYYAMGIGLKSILEKMTGYYIFSRIIRWGAFALAAGVAIYSFRDAIVFRKTRDTGELKLQLPKAVKLRIHKIISGNLSGAGIFIGAIVTGFLVTILEAICTGQMYLPYIVAMTQKNSLRIYGYLYLALYNFLFVLPLLIVMVLAYYGMKWNDLAKKTQKNMIFLKIALGTVMTGLAVYIATGLIPH